MKPKPAAERNILLQGTRENNDSLPEQGFPGAINKRA